MKSSGVIALVAAGAVIGGGAVAYELNKPDSGSVRVNYVEPAATTTTAPTATPTSTPKVSATATATTSSASSSVTSKSTTRKATVRKEATVSQPQQTTQSSQPAPDTTTKAPASPSGPPPVIWGSQDQTLKPKKP